MSDPVVKISHEFENMSAEQIADVVAIGLNVIKIRIKKVDKHLYERWKAGGFLVEDSVVSMYPNISEVIESIDDDDEYEDDDDDDFGGFIGGLGSN